MIHEAILVHWIRAGLVGANQDNGEHPRVVGCQPVEEVVSWVPQRW